MWGFIEIVVFLFFYWLFYPRVRAMAEVIMTRSSEVLEHIITATSSKDALKQKQIQQLGTIGTPRPTAYHNKVSRIITDKALDRQLKRNRLSNIKNIPRIITTSSYKPSIPDCCEKCSPSSKTLMIETLRNFGARNFLQVDEELHSSSWFAKQFCHLRAATSVPTHYFPQVISSVLKDERLLQAVEMAARMDSNDSARNREAINSETPNGVYNFKSFLERHQKRAENLLMSMRSTMSNTLLRFIAWLVYKLLPKLLPSCVGHPEQFEMLRRASETGLPLIFLPLHRSHIDYIVVTFILLMNNIKPPLVAAGDNLKIPFFGWLLRGLGAFYIKRRIDPVQGRKDIVYRAVLHTYMLESLRAGYNIEFFIEGGRTRTGKPCMPKAGLLSVIIDAYLDGTIEDALLVPVAINYDRLVDGNFVREQLGQPKKMESFTSAVSAIWQVFRSSYGMLRIDFNPPFSLKELMKNSNLRAKAFNDDELTDSYDKLHEVPSSTSLYGSDYVSNEQREVVDRIARHIVFDSARSMSVMSTNLLSYILLYRYRNGGTRETIAADMDFLRREIACRDCELGFSGDSIDVIDHAIQVLGPALVRRDGDRIIPVTLLPNVIELAYYANTMVYLQSLDSVLATAIGSLGAITGKNTFSDEEVIQNALGLCDILQYEFIFCRPCQNIRQAIFDCLDSFVCRGLVNRDCEAISDDEIWSQNFAKNFESDDDERESSPKKADVSTFTSSNLKELITMQSSLSPFIDAYTVSALCLCGLVERQVTERDLIQEILAETKNQFDLGISKYGESLSSDSIRGSLKLFERWGVLECQHEGKNKLYYLSESYDNDTEIRKVLERIHKYKL